MSWGRRFKSQHRILDGYFSHIFVEIFFVWKDENTQKVAGDGPFLKKVFLFLFCSDHFFFFLLVLSKKHFRRRPNFPPPFFRYSLDLWGQPRDIDYTPRWRNGPFRYSHNRSPKHKLVLLWRKCGHSQRWEKIGCKIAERNNEWKAPTHKHGKMARFNEKQVKFRSLWNEVFF